jgi:hypothetical protein
MTNSRATPPTRKMSRNTSPAPSAVDSQPVVIEVCDLHGDLLLVVGPEWVAF